MEYKVMNDNILRVFERYSDCGYIIAELLTKNCRDNFEDIVNIIRDDDFKYSYMLINDVEFGLIFSNKEDVNNRKYIQLKNLYINIRNKFLSINLVKAKFESDIYTNNVEDIFVPKGPSSLANAYIRKGEIFFKP